MNKNWHRDRIDELRQNYDVHKTQLLVILSGFLGFATIVYQVHYNSTDLIVIVANWLVFFIFGSILFLHVLIISSRMRIIFKKLRRNYDALLGANSTAK